MKIQKTNFKRVPEIEGGIVVMGVKFQAFLHPDTKEPVFSQSGTADALNIRESSVRRIRQSKEFKTLRGGDFLTARLDTEINSRPIAVVTPIDLVCLVQIAAEKGNPIAREMQIANFATRLQESVDKALRVQRSPSEYLEAGAKLRRELSSMRPYEDRKFLKAQTRNKHRTTYSHRKHILTARGVHPRSQGHITRQDYKILLRKDTKQLREELGLSKTDLIIDHLETSDQATLSFAHVMQVESLEIKDIHGYDTVKNECGDIMQKVVDFRGLLRQNASNQINTSKKKKLKFPDLIGPNT